MLNKAMELLNQKINEICEVQHRLENMECDDCQAVEKAQDLLSELVRVYQSEVNEIVRLEREKDSK